MHVVMRCVALGAVTGCQLVAGLSERSVPPGTCLHNSECASDEVCLFQVCTDECFTDVDCPRGERCLEIGAKAACVADDQVACETDRTCPGETRCSNGSCRTPCGDASMPGCRKDQSCIDDACVGNDGAQDSGASTIGAGGEGGEPSAGATNGGRSGMASGGMGGQPTGGSSAGGAQTGSAAGGAPMGGSNGSGGAGVEPPPDEWAHWPMPNPTGTGLPHESDYADNGNGTITDNVTGLVWQAAVAQESYSWQEANQYCRDLALDNGGWRLPTAIELESLWDYTRARPAIDPIFTGTPGEGFWSSSPLAGGASSAWLVNFEDGGIGGLIVSALAGARCVRSGALPAPPHYENTDVDAIAAVTDNWTGLVWQRSFSGVTASFEMAAQYCQSLGAGGWRAPSIKELQTLVDRGTQGPSIDAVFFPDTPSEVFWTSSRWAGSASESWGVDFTNGSNHDDPVAEDPVVRCVR